MLVESVFKRTFCCADVAFQVIVFVVCHLCQVDNIFCLAFSSEWARVKSQRKERIKYEPERAATNKTQEKWKIIWFNPPYSMNVQTNVARKFLQLIDKHFPAEHKLHKIFNRNTVEVSYSCVPNTSSIIKAHNRKTLEGEPNKTSPKCNCRNFIYIYIYIDIYIYIYRYISVYLYRYIYIGISVPVYLYPCICTRVSVSVCISISVYIYLYIYIYTPMTSTTKVTALE